MCHRQNTRRAGQPVQHKTVHLEADVPVIGNVLELKASSVDAPSEQVSTALEGASDIHKSAQLLDRPTPNQLPQLTTDLLTHISSVTDGIDLPVMLHGCYNKDEFFKKILNAPKEFKNFWVQDGLVYMKEKHAEVLCVPHITLGERSMREIVILHAHLLLTHLEAYKTLGVTKFRALVLLFFLSLVT